MTQKGIPYIKMFSSLSRLVFCMLQRLDIFGASLLKFIEHNNIDLH